MTMLSFENAKFSDLRADLAANVKSGGLVIITGEPGAGKTFVMHQTMTNRKLWLNLDDLGAEVNSAWTIDLKKLEKRVREGARILVGCSDNMEAVAKTAVSALDREDPTVYCYLLVPDHSVFREANRLKSEQYKGELSSFRKFWLDASKLSVKGFADVIKKKGRQLASHIQRGAANASVLFRWLEVPKQGKPVNGWHELEEKDGALIDKTKEVNHAE